LQHITDYSRFRWVTCQIDFLRTLANDRERREALEKLPPTLPETYERILQRANSGGESIQMIVQKSLRWVTFSMQSLTLSALAEAISIEVGAQHLNTDDIVDEAAILDGCGSLIRVSAPGNVVELAHFTVQEFLTTIKLRGGAQFKKYHVDEELAHLHMATICLTHCCLDNFGTRNISSEEELDSESRQYPLRQYAVSSWFDHARRHLHDPQVMALARQLFQPSKSTNFISWVVRFVTRSGAFAPRLEDDPLLCIRNMTTLHWASFLLLPELCQCLIEEGQDANRPGELGRPLHAAVCHGWISKAQWRGLVLARAARDYQLQVVEILHSGKADLNALADMTGLSGDYVELDDASLRREDPESHVFTLREMSPLSLSIIIGTSSVFRYLLKAGVVANAKCLEHFRGDKDVLGLVGEANLRNEDRAFFLNLVLQTPGLESSTKDFLQRSGQNPPLKTPGATSYTSSFFTAAECGQHEVVTTLLTKFDVQPDLRNSSGNAAIHLAADNDHVEVIKTLLAFDADMNCTNDSGDTALHIAARRQDAKCVEILTAHVSDLNKVNGENMSPFHIAAVSKNLFALRFLVQWANSHGVNIGMKGFHDGRPLLLFAAQGGSLEVIDYILDTMHDVDVFARAENGWNGLHLASDSAADDAVHRFLQLGLRADDKTNDGFAPLFLAVTSQVLESEPNKSLAVVKRLLENGANVDAITNSGTTALHSICWRNVDYEGYRIFEALVEHGASANLKNERDETALTLLCAQITSVPHNLRLIYVKMLRKLISSGAEVDAVCSHGDSAFSMAATYFVEMSSAHLDKARDGDVYFATLVMESMLEHARFDSSNIRSTLGKVDVWDSALQLKDDDLITRLVEFLPQVGMRNPSLSNFSPLERACLHGCSSIVFERLNELLGSTTLHETDRGMSLLHYAAAGGQVHLIGGLLDRGYALEECTLLSRMTPLLGAVEQGHVQVVKALIEKGANLTARDINGWDATHHACFGGHSDVLSLLIEHGVRTDRRVDVKSGLFRGASCLHLAALLGHSCIVVFLMKHCPDMHKVDDVTNESETALEVATRGGSADTVSTLLSYGAAIEGLSGSKTPLCIAALMGHEAIVRHLLQAGANAAKHDSQGFTAEVRALQEGHHEVVRIIREHNSLQGTTLHLRIVYRNSTSN
jgi:ankyrin repeat protein